MQLVTFRRHGESRHEARIGALVGNQVVDLSRAYQGLLERRGHPRPWSLAEALLPRDMVAFLHGGAVALEAAREAAAFAQEEGAAGAPGALLPLAQVQLLAPVPRPGKIVCVGQNYREHILEMKREIPQHPVLFAKFAHTVIGPGDPIRIPRVSRAVDYEAEVAVVIGRRCRYVGEDEALQYVAGYTIANDISVRDFQYRTSQWMQGKNFDGSCPLGPCIATADALDPANLEIALTVNGQERQRANTASLVFTVPFLIAYLSQIMTLEPGDLILTGTPGGVGHAMQPPGYLQPGDVVRITVPGIGTLENPVVAEED